MEKVSKIEFILLKAENNDISMRDTESVANSFIDDVPEEFIPPEKLDK